MSLKLVLPLARVECKAPMTVTHPQKASKLTQTTIGDFGRAWAANKPACWPAMKGAKIATKIVGHMHAHVGCQLGSQSWYLFGMNTTPQPFMATCTDTHMHV